MNRKTLIPAIIAVLIIVFTLYFLEQREPEANTGLASLDVEAFLESAEVTNLLNSRQKHTTLLTPYLSAESIGFEKSKMGGTPNLNGFEEWPTCDVCGTCLNFVVQIYNDDFPEFYFPDNKNIFQVFRCPNIDCLDSYNDKYDLKMFHFYFNVTRDANKNVTKPLYTMTSLEAVVPDCYFKPITVTDFPNFDEYTDNEWEPFIEKYSDDLIDLFIEEYSAKIGTKFNGYPSWTQNSNYPTCFCGKVKEFFFQLSSEDRQEGQDDQWSPHGIMIGDVGNIYFFVCRDCGEKSIETNWDCF